MAKPGTDRDGAMVEKTTGKKSKEKISPFTKTPKLDRSEIMGKEGKPKSSMKRKLSFSVSPPRNGERDSDTDDSDPGQSSDMWGERLLPPCRIYADKDGPDKKRVKKESGGKKSTPVNILFGYPLSERKQMALLMQMTARDNSPDTTPSHPSQAPAVQKKTPNSSTSRQKDKVNKRNERGETPLHMAAIRGDVKQVKELIGLGADVNMKDFAGWTPLHEACNLGYYDVAKVLIGAGAEVNTQGLDDDTPLHDASSSGHKDIVKLLLQHGGNAFQANKRGERPVDVADSQEVEQLLKGEIPLSDPDDSSSDSEDPPSVNPSSVDENMEYSDTEKDSDGKSTTAKATSSVSGVDEYEFKDEEEEEDLSKALNDRHILRREVRQKEKEEKEENHYTPKQSNKSDQAASSCKVKKAKSSRVLYCSSDSSDDEIEASSERKCSPTRSLCNDTHKTESRTKRESLTITSTEKGKANKKNKSKNKENQEVQEDGKENSKSLLFSAATVSDNSDKSVREEDSFKMSFSPKDDSSVHLFHLSAVKSPKLGYGQTDKQMTPLKQENAKTFVSIGDGSCPMDCVKYNHYTDSDYTEGSSSKSCKHKDKSKHHYKENSVDGDDRSSSPFKDASLSNSMDSSEGVFRKAEKDGKVVKKHKLKHKEKDKYRKDYESERNRHRQKELRKDGHRNLEFDREFWKENFFKSDESEELKGKSETPGSCSPPQKSIDSSPVKEEKATLKDKHSVCNSNKERKQKDEREKDRPVKKEKKEMAYKDERGGKEGKGAENDDRSECLNLLRKPEDSIPSLFIKEEVEDKPLTGNLLDHNQLETTEKGSQEKNEKRLPTKDRESEKCEKKQAEKEKRAKLEHLSDKSDLHNSTDRWKERDRLTSTSNLSGERSHKENEKLKPVPVTKKYEENKKSKDKLERRSEKERQEKEHSSSGDHRDKDRTSSEKKGKAPEKNSDHSKNDRIKEKEREKDKDSDKKKKEKSKEAPLSSSSSNLKSLLEEKKGYSSESNKAVTLKIKEEVMKTPEKDRDRRERDRDLERHRDRERHKDKDKERTQQNRDGKPCKTRPVESESDRSKSKASTTQKETRPKEKRLDNDDLMRTSFERMLSLKDQEIEQWHKKHLEKIKQKERERLKQRPGADSAKQKNKDKAKIPTSTEPHANKELLRSKSSEIPETSSREKMSKDAAGGRTLSLDAKNLSCFGKSGPVIENSLSRSPRPDSERSGIISRSVSMISVASSEDSCQASMSTPRPAEYDSDLNLDASDSQPPFLQSSLIVQSSRSPILNDKETSSLPDMASGIRTPLQSKLASPFLRAVLDEDAKAVLCEPDRPTEESQKVGDVAHSGEEPGKIHQTEPSGAVTQESLTIHSSVSVHLPGTIPETEQAVGVEDASSSSSSQSACVSNSREASVKDNASQQTSLSQASGLLPNAAEVSKLDADTLSEQSGQNQLDSPDAETTEGSNKTSSLTCVAQVAQAASSQPEQSSTKAPTHSLNLTWDSLSDQNNDQLPRIDLELRLEKRTRSLSMGPEIIMEARCMENVSAGNAMDWTASQAPPVGSCRSSSEESTKAPPCTVSVLRDSQQVAERISPDDRRSSHSSENVGAADAQLEMKDFSLPVPSISNVLHCSSPEQISEEPMEVSGEEPDHSQVIAETQVEKVVAAEDAAQTQPLQDSKADVDAEMRDQLDGEEKSAKPGTPSDGEQNLGCTGVQLDSQSELTSGATSGSSSPLSVVDRDSDPTGARTKAKTLDDEVDIQATHPRKRKMHRASPSTQASLSAQQIKEKAQQSLAAIVDSLKLEEIQPYQTERANPYYEFLHIRKKIEEKRKVLFSVIPQAPQYYDEYVTFNGSYLLDGNPLSKLCIPTIAPPPSLPEPLKEMFKQQEVVRMKLRLQHSIEREKLIVSNEQEVLRVHYRAARTLANQTLPFSACTVLLDAEVYNMPQDVQGDDGKTSVRDRFNARQFMSWLQDVDDKFDKLKTCLLMRQQHEAAALNAVQRLEWQLKLQELDPATYKSTSIFEIPEFHIPLVEVNDDFDLTPI
ncbi:ankyrin repeat domain-containing protein 12 isoform X1 [Tachysurus fulvidraco]|uniref:ankyrin repeat domain-containing protein 12 isoform X1 n=1 Tax=Tachysurus fulvidraco TaxID=1234273 RepID=UPI001FEDA9BB|nr:ankyrin repeat domain-containing protein 12 isoform X1 [Tachysurus fulvidraco]XP_027006547.2 ankyrin repeat domain-containing protein 12 isoform X1 [Tachysurus fulvidraco]